MVFVQVRCCYCSTQSVASLVVMCCLYSPAGKTLQEDDEEDCLCERPKVTDSSPAQDALRRVEPMMADALYFELFSVVESALSPCIHRPECFWLLGLYSASVGALSPSMPGSRSKKNLLSKALSLDFCLVPAGCRHTRSEPEGGSGFAQARRVPRGRQRSWVLKSFHLR